MKNNKVILLVALCFSVLFQCTYSVAQDVSKLPDRTTKLLPDLDPDVIQAIKAANTKYGFSITGNIEIDEPILKTKVLTINASTVDSG